jgi:hypothetical protein
MRRHVPIKLLGAGVAFTVLLGLGAQPEMKTPEGVVTPAERVPTIEDFAPMAGHWRTEAQGRVYEEMWLPPAHGQMTGVLRSFDAEGAPLLFELITLREIEGGVEYRLRHFDGEMTPWESEADSPMILRARRHTAGRTLFDEVEGADSLEGAIIDLGTPGRMAFIMSFTKEKGGRGFRLTFEKVEPEPRADG